MANPWFPFYLDDYERKTSHLTMLQHGAYLELIRHYYMAGGPLPANAQQLHRICRANDPQEIAAIDYCLKEFFVKNEDGDGCYHHTRCDEEMAKSKKISEKRSKSANARHMQVHSNCNANAPANAQQMQTQLQPHLHTHKEKERADPDSTPECLHQNQYAARLLEDLGMPEVRNLIELVAACISVTAKKDNITKAEAFESIRKQALNDQNAGVEINRWWFEKPRHSASIVQARPRLVNAAEAKRKALGLVNG